MERDCIKDKKTPVLADLIKRIESSGNDVLTHIAGRMYEALEALKNAGVILFPQSSLDEIFDMDEAEFRAFIHDIKCGGYIKWHVDDIIFVLKCWYPLIDEADAQVILSSILNGHDADYGICWESIRASVQANEYDKTHRSRMAKEFPFPLQEGKMDWLDSYMTKKTWEAGRYEEFLLSLTDDDNIRSQVTLLLRRDPLSGRFKNNVAYYYFLLLRFANDNNFPAIAMFAPHLTAMLVRDILQDGGECEL